MGKEKKTNTNIFNYPFSCLFFNNIFPTNYFKSYSLSKLKTFSTQVDKIIYKDGKVISCFNYEKRNKTIVVLQFKNIIGVTDILLENPISFNIFYSPDLQLDYYNAYKDTAYNIIPSWFDIKFECSCGSDYLNPCWHIAGTFMRLLYEIDKDIKILFKIQGVDLSKIIERENNVNKLLNSIKNNSNNQSSSL